MRVSLNASVLPDTKVGIEALAAMFQRSSGSVIDLMSASYLTSLPEESRIAIEALKAASLVHVNSPAAPATSVPAATYRFSRLCFRRDIIESLGPDESFQVVTPVGTFQMTKADFYGSFQNVVESKSYSEGGIYHYPKLPARAERFRVS
ncbi:MAG TPA: hypothetical protein VG273_13610 [Bryobacteraceae bacterium]|jgi:hypothetical protein|nr:hypothetical protein [Bryobacteraceae bacterium]